LFQEIWPEENPDGGNYLDKTYEEQYKREIELGIDAIHGAANIPERKGRAYGLYTADVSDYVIGYLVGRELEPEEVKNTNKLNAGYSYKGEFISSEDKASPTEAWLAMNCDYTVKYENEKYNTQHPAAIVSWPTLDPIEHDSEWNEKGVKESEYNDSVAVDINNIRREEKNVTGFFGAYHIYPNYPDFMNNEPKYGSYSDEEGTFRYGGYLKEFIEGHTKYPALVAEFGLATGMGNAHTNPDGYNHGGMTEEQQGEGVVRMMKAIKNEGYAGGVVFQWMDEWAKKTWITEPFMIPYDRHALWHNVVDPEQNYGILSMETEKPDKAEYSLQGSGEISSINMSQDEAFLYIDLSLKGNVDLGSKKLLIGLDTYDRNRGEFRYSQSIEAKSQSGMEFLIELTGKETSKLLVHPGYNIYSDRYSSYASSSGVFEEIKPVINESRVTKDGTKTPALIQDGSRLVYGDFKDNIYNYWYAEGSDIHIRIPWQRLNFSDPSTLKVIDDTRIIDKPVKDELKTVTTAGIVPSVLLVNTADNKVLAEINTTEANSAAYAWKGWEQPKFVERLKKSYDIISKYFEQLK
jgi:protein associated with RNAse G/E